jgi:hypothetical protein
MARLGPDGRLLTGARVGQRPLYRSVLHGLSHYKALCLHLQILGQRYLA